MTKRRLFSASELRPLSTLKFSPQADWPNSGQSAIKIDKYKSTTCFQPSFQRNFWRIGMHIYRFKGPSQKGYGSMERMADIILGPWYVGMDPDPHHWLTDQAPESGSKFFRQCLTRCQQKKNFSSHLQSGFNFHRKRSPKRSHKII